MAGRTDVLFCAVIPLQDHRPFVLCRPAGTANTKVTSSMLSHRVLHTGITAIIAALLIALRPACSAILDPAAFAQNLRDNRQDAIAADSLLGKLNLPTGVTQRQNTYYAALNSYVPVGVHVNCHFGPEPLNGKASASASAKQYINDVAYIAGDGYQPVIGEQEKGTYNQSWSGGLVWKGWCQIFDGHPSCNFTFDAVSRASGLAQITRVPKGGTVKFVSCGVYMDKGVLNSTSCFQDDSTTVVPVTVPYAEESVSNIYFISTYRDSAADGPPGDYSLTYACQFGWNSFSVINPLTDAVGLDPRLTAALPNHQNGGFGPVGNGGNGGRRLLKQA
ncbi:hypothetical protein COCOBI_13-2360 [Coccomyxa sp. Obi]|nr:hypothetical protein COCOBI_13-2360 [Coccomyxa sp. Obi]